MPISLLRVAPVLAVLLLTAGAARADFGEALLEISCHSVAVTSVQMIGISLQASSQATTESPPVPRDQPAAAEPPSAAQIAAAQRRDQIRFVVANHHSMRNDIAAGGGEYVQAYASLLGCAGDVRGLLIEGLREHYPWLYSGDLTPV